MPAGVALRSSHIETCPVQVTALRSSCLQAYVRPEYELP